MSVSAISATAAAASPASGAEAELGCVSGLAKFQTSEGELFLVGNGPDLNRARYNLNIVCGSSLDESYMRFSPLERVFFATAEMNQNVFDWFASAMHKLHPDATLGLRAFLDQEAGLYAPSRMVRTIHSPTVVSLFGKPPLDSEQEAPLLLFGLDLATKTLHILQAGQGMVNMARLLPIANSSKQSHEFSGDMQDYLPQGGSHGVGAKQLFLLSKSFGWEIEMRGSVSFAAGSNQEDFTAVVRPIKCPVSSTICVEGWKESIDKLLPSEAIAAFGGDQFLVEFIRQTHTCACLYQQISFSSETDVSEEEFLQAFRLSHALLRSPESLAQDTFLSSAHPDLPYYTPSDELACLLPVEGLCDRLKRASVIYLNGVPLTLKLDDNYSRDCDKLVVSKDVRKYSRSERGRSTQTSDLPSMGDLLLPIAGNRGAAYPLFKELLDRAIADPMKDLAKEISLHSCTDWRDSIERYFGARYANSFLKSELEELDMEIPQDIEREMHIVDLEAEIGPFAIWITEGLNNISMFEFYRQEKYDYFNRSEDDDFNKTPVNVPFKSFREVSSQLKLARFKPVYADRLVIRSLLPTSEQPSTAPLSFEQMARKSMLRFIGFASKVVFYFNDFPQAYRDKDFHSNWYILSIERMLCMKDESSFRFDNFPMRLDALDVSELNHAQAVAKRFRQPSAFTRNVRVCIKDDSNAIFSSVVQLPTRDNDSDEHTDEDVVDITPGPASITTPSNSRKRKASDISKRTSHTNNGLKKFMFILYERDIVAEFEKAHQNDYMRNLMEADASSSAAAAAPFSPARARKVHAVQDLSVFYATRFFNEVLVKMGVRCKFPQLILNDLLEQQTKSPERQEFAISAEVRKLLEFQDRLEQVGSVCF